MKISYGEKEFYNITLNLSTSRNIEMVRSDLYKILTIYLENTCKRIRKEITVRYSFPENKRFIEIWLCIGQCQFLSILQW